MRTIKFKAWDKIKKEMIVSGIEYNIRLLSHICESDKVENPPQIGFTEFDWDRFDILQFTGLTDKNGKEIYEGDILRNKLSYLNGRPTDNENPVYKNYKVDWHNGNKLGFRIKNKHNIMPLNRNKVYNAKSEIIGNIYENPELL